MAKKSKSLKPAPSHTPGDADIPFELPAVTPAEKKRAAQLLQALEREYPTAHCELTYSQPHELLIATILSAQTTDAGVNKATPALFARFPTPADYARSSPAEIEPFIRTLGFFRMKAKAVHLAMQAVVEHHGGKIPSTMDQLLALQGVARKTANVLLGNAYGINVGFVVDTHIQRLSERFGLVPPGSSVQVIERRLMALFPRDRWCDLSHMIIWHGRRACKARGVACSQHPICAEFGVACELRDFGPGKKVSSSTSAAPGRRKKKPRPS